MNKNQKSALLRSKSIDHQIDEAREKREKEVQLLILGAAGSGKSTFSKQLNLLYGQGFPDEERDAWKAYVYDNVTEALRVITEHMDVLAIDYASADTKKVAREFQSQLPPRRSFPISPADITLTQSSNADDHHKITSDILSASSEKETDRLSPLPAIKDGRNDINSTYFRYQYNQGWSPYTVEKSMLIKLWTDKGVQECYKRRAEYDLPATFEIFLEDFQRIMSDSYIPTIQDILYIRMPTLGVQEQEFATHGLNFRIIDVAGQKSQRKKWIHFFESVTAVIFFVSLTGFCETLEEDTTQNTLKDSLKLFGDLLFDRFLVQKKFILFLNKKDLLEKIVAHKNIKDYFPEFKGEPRSGESVIDFIMKLFMSCTKQQKELSVHVSTATDLDLMKKVVPEVMQTITDMNVRRAENF